MRPTGHASKPAEDALKLTAYFGERNRAHGRLLADELVDVFGRHEVHSSILLRGAQGFGAKHRLRTDRLLTLSEDLPVMAVAVDRSARIEALLDDVAQLTGGCLVTLERAHMLDPASAWGDASRRPHGAVRADVAVAPSAAARPHIADRDDTAARPDAVGDALKLTVYMGRHERVNGRPGFAAACQLLHERGVAGATVLLGVDGTRRGRRERAGFFAGNARVPMLVLAVGSRAEVEDSLVELEHMLPDALFTIERVRIRKRDGQLLDDPRRAVDEHGPSVLQRLTIVTSEAARHDGHPVHLQLVRRLRASHAAGATSLRGIWGFHGEHPPHGDRLLAIRRHVPVVTIAIDTPERISQLFGIVDELTRERGLVTSEMLPANMALSRGCSSVG